MPNLEESYTTKLFDRIHAAFTKLETRLDATNRRIGNLRAPPRPEPPPHPTPGPLYAQRTRRSYLPHSQSQPRTPPYSSRPSPYISPDTYSQQPYSCWDCDPPGVLNDYYQPPHARSNSSLYTARQNAYQPPRNTFTSGDQFMEQERPLRQPYCARRSPNPGWFSPESYQQQFVPAKKPTCWDPPVLGQYVGFPVYDAPPARPTMCWDQPEKRIQQRVSAYEPQPPTCWPTPPQPSPVRQPTCWDPPEQQGYPPHEPPTLVEPLDRGYVKFRPLSQPPQPHRYRSEVVEDRCYGEVVTHTHSQTLDVSLGSYVCGYANELTDQNEVDSYSSSLDLQIAYSCSDCICDRGKGEEELCDSEDSILETTAKKVMDRGLLSENRGSREGRDGRPEDQQVSSVEEIYPLRSPDMSNEKEEEALLDDVEEDDSTEEVKKVVALFNVVQVPSKNVIGNCWGKKGDGVYTGLPVIACVYVDLNVGDVTSVNHRSTSLDTDARLIPPSNDTPCLSILGGVDKLFVLAWNFANHIRSPLLIFDGGNGRRRSAVRCAFDPGGDASTKLLLSTLVVALWFPP